jgi:hypothetical protein
MEGSIKRVLCLGLALCGSAYAQNFPYLNDANSQADGPAVAGNFPKVVASETQSDKGSVEAWSKYDVIGAKSGMLYKVVAAQQINPDLEFHYSFHPRSYLGYIAPSPCDISMGMPFNSTAASTQGCSVYAGHWMYRAGTRLSQNIGASATTVRVADASRLAVGQYAVIYAAPVASFNNAEHVRISAIDKSVTPHRVTLSQRGFKSVARSHSSNAIIAMHEQGRAGNKENWAYNISATGPRDGNNQTIAQVMANWIPVNMNRNSKGVLQNVNVTGVYFDEDEYYLWAQSVDANNDLVVDNGILYGGRNVWGEGLDEFYRLVKNRLPGKRVVGGWRQTRGFKSLNGIQMENWLLAGNDFAVNPVYTGRGGIYSQLHNYMIHGSYHEPAKGYMEALSKAPTKLYPGTVKSGPNPTVPANNANFRLGLGATLLGNGHYGRQNSRLHPDPWYDEYAVNVNPDSPNYGHAIASNSNDESQIRRHKGWLGKPLGDRKRLYNSQQFKPEASMISNGGFESGTTGWVFNNVDKLIDTSVRVEGARALKTLGHSTYSKNEGGASVKGPSINLVKGRQYTLVFAAKSSKMREVLVQLGASGDHGIYLMPERWTRFVYTVTAKNSGAFRPIIYLGREDTTVWIDDVHVFEGDPNVFRRDFENGIVVVNATPKSRTVNLGGQFLRIKGTGQDSINNGAQISTLTLPAFDAAILVRTDEPPVIEPPLPPVSGNVSVGGRAWKDVNGDGIRGSGETDVYSGLTVKLLSCSAVALASTTSNSQGIYLFEGLGAGSYRLLISMPPQTNFSPAFVGSRGDLDSNISQWPGQTACMSLVDGNRRLAVDAGLIPTAPPVDSNLGTIGDYVWFDANRNGIQNSAESGMPNVVIRVADCEENLLKTVRTGNSGSYQFSLAAGSYKLKFIAPVGYKLTKSLAGSSRAADSNPNPTSGWSGCMNINAGENRQWFDAGFVTE